MKLSSRPLRFLAFAFLILIVSLLVLYQHRIASNDIPSPEPDQVQMDIFPANLFRNAAAQPWFDSTAFRTIIRRGLYDPNAYYMISMSGVGPEFQIHTAFDTSMALLALEMSYEVKQLARAQSATFQTALKKMQQEIPSVAYYGKRMQYLPLADSINAFVYYKFGLTSKQQQSSKNFGSIDSLFLMKYGWGKMILNEIKPGLSDTLWALKAIYKNTCLPKNK